MSKTTGQKIIYHPKSYYLALRAKYKPGKMRCIIIAESPPLSGKYFYNAIGLSTEPLFAALMKVIKYKRPNKLKGGGLKEFKEKGFYLVDSTYCQIDKHPQEQRNAIIKRDLDELSRYLKKAKRIPIMLIKRNVCQILNPYLKEKGFDVINNGITVPFPAYGNQRRFHEIASRLLRKRKII